MCGRWRAWCRTNRRPGVFVAGLMTVGSKLDMLLCDFVPAMVDLVAETKVQGKVRAQLPIVLNEHLRALQARTILGREHLRSNC